MAVQSKDIAAEIVRWIIPLVCAFFYGRIQTAWKKWGSLDARLKELTDGQKAIADLQKAQHADYSGLVTRALTSLEKRLNARFSAMDARSMRHELRVVRMQERLGQVLLLVAPAQAQAIIKEWAVQDELDRRSHNEDEEKPQHIWRPGEEEES